MIQLSNRFVSFKNVLLAIAETMGILVAVIVSDLIHHQQDLIAHLADTQLMIRDVSVVVVFQISFFLCDMYEYRAFSDIKILIYRCLTSMGAACVMLMVLFSLFPDFYRGRGRYVLTAVVVTVMVITARSIAIRFFSFSFLQEKILILGTGEQAQACAKAILDRKDLGLIIVGFLGNDSQLIGRSLVNPKVVGSVHDLEYFVHLLQIRRIIVALEDRRAHLPLDELLNLRFRGVAVEDTPSIYEKVTGKIHIQHLRPSWFVFGDSRPRTWFFMAVKRTCDIVAASIGLLLTAPLFLIIPILIRLESRGPVYYTQTRVGANNRNFHLLKFRTMVVDAEKGSGPQLATQRDPRVTRLGRFLRRSRLDEIPQFLNILIGDMSFVGPRPERPEFVEQLEQTIPYYRLRHCIKPGLTGWAQVNHTYCSTHEEMVEKLQHDLYYIKNISFMMDFMIVLKTIKTVLYARGSR